MATNEILGEFYDFEQGTRNVEMLGRFFAKYPQYADKTFLSVKVPSLSILRSVPFADGFLSPYRVDSYPAGFNRTAARKTFDAASTTSSRVSAATSASISSNAHVSIPR